MDSRPIGVFDSGLGGLTVVKSIKTLLPNESIIYFGDTARVPYGNKSRELIKEYSSEITEFLVKKDVKMVVVACNTVSAMVLNTLKINNSEESFLFDPFVLQNETVALLYVYEKFEEAFSTIENSYSYIESIAKEKKVVDYIDNWLIDAKKEVYINIFVEE